MPTTTSEKKLFLKERELGALLEITQAINQDHTEAALYRIFQFTLLGQLNIRRLVLYVLEEGRWECMTYFGAGLADFRQLALPDAVVAQCGSLPCPLRELPPLGPAWDNLEVVIPVVRNGQVLAYVFIGNAHEDYVGEEATKFLQTLSNILVGAIENRRLVRQRMASAAMRKEIEIARDVQTMLFPRHLPNDAHLAVHASYVPHTAVGGDYYDVVELPDNRVLLCVADVSGKGVAASLLMSNFQAGLRTLLRQGVELATVVHELNHLIFRNAGGDKFITVFFGLYDRTTRELQYVNAGHNDPLLLLDGGSVGLPLKEGTIMLGVMEDLPMLNVGRRQVPPHSLLLAYTDGLTEVFDAEQNEFGEEGVLQVLRHNRYAPLRTLHTELLREITTFDQAGTGFADDVTILSCRFK